MGGLIVHEWLSANGTKEVVISGTNDFQGLSRREFIQNALDHLLPYAIYFPVMYFCMS